MGPAPSSQTLLNLGLLLRPDLFDILARGIVGRRDLVERVIGVLLKLLLDALLALVEPQARPAAVRLHLVEPALLVLGIRGRVSPLRVLVDLGGVRVGRERQRVEGVVDARGVEGCRLLVAGAVVVELGQIQAARPLDRRLGLLGLGSPASSLLVLFQQGFLLGLLPRSFCLLGSFGLPRTPACQLPSTSA